MDFSTLDYFIILILLLSTLISLWRGFTKEVLSLVALGLSAWIMLTFSSFFSDLIAPYIENVKIRIIVALVTLFLMTLATISLINKVIIKLIDISGLTLYDRLFGTIFGAVRAGLLIVFCALLASLSNIPQQAWWQDSILMPHFEAIASWLPQFFNEHLRPYFQF